MAEQDPLLQKKLSWLKRQKEIPMIPLNGDGVVTIQGRDILDLKYVENSALVAITKLGDFYLIPTHQYENRTT